MSLLKTGLKSVGLDKRTVFFGILAVCVYALTVVAGGLQSAPYWPPFPLWIFSLPVSLFLANFYRTPPHYLTWGINAVLWFVAGVLLSWLSKRNWLVILVMAILIVAVGMGLYLWLVMTVGSLGI